MRIFALSLSLLTALAALHPQDAVTFADDAAASLFRTARMNMSGREATIRELLSLRMSGSIRISTPEGSEDRGTTEMRILLTDRFL